MNDRRIIGAEDPEIERKMRELQGKAQQDLLRLQVEHMQRQTVALERIATLLEKAVITVDAPEGEGESHGFHNPLRPIG